MAHKKKVWRFATGDFETDPFLKNRVPMPFCVGIYDGKQKWNYWGDDCVQAFIDKISEMPSTIFYFHNGGKFDFHFLIKHFRGKIRIVNRRILQAFIECPNGTRHEFRDSYAILPVPLAKFNKDEISYELFERTVRNRHRAKILHYMDNDCKYLYDAVSTFIEEFPTTRGPKLTMASAAMSALKRFHNFDTLDGGTDSLLRPYYFGGRNQCFRTGIIRGNYKLFDVNSMYPNAMAKYLHPIGRPTDFGNTRINKKTYFATVIGTNYGALPQRMPDGSLSFTQDTGTFFASIHELNAAEETGTFKIHKVLSTVEFDRVGTFDEFVYHFWDRRMDAVKIEGKEGAHVTLYKLISNGAYGKFAQDPSKFMDYEITDNEIPEGEDWLPCDEIYDYIIWEKPTEQVFGNSFFNVATGASITGASRADLLRGISKAVDPLYCDTDSLLCKSLDLPQGSGLGEWKLECEGNLVAIAGKKTYAVMSDKAEDIAKQIAKDKNLPFAKYQGKKFAVMKKASKGVRLSPDQIIDTALDKEVEYANPVPNFRLRIANSDKRKVSTGKTGFITRKITRTAA